ncbi:MAG: RidA family protein [SAR202 cluster bacterium]|nr:RidA family protein [SAR202 cluster bacterium]
MPKKEIITAPGLPASKVTSHAVKFGNVVYVSGRSGRDPKTGQYSADIKIQTRQTLDDIKKALEAAGASFDNVLSNTIHITDSKNFAAFNEVYLEYFPKDKPARTTVQAGMMSQGSLIEITTIAGIPS